MPRKEKRKQVTLSLYNDDIRRLEEACARTNSTKSEYIRFVLHFLVPQALPDHMFWELMNELYTIHDKIKTNAGNEAIILSACKELEEWILKFQAKSTSPWKVG